MNKSHNLKTVPPFWQDIASGKKTFELRINDRNYEVGDVLNLMEYIPESGKYTGNVCNAEVTYILDKFQDVLKKDWCILGIKLIELPF